MDYVTLASLLVVPVEWFARAVAAVRKHKQEELGERILEHLAEKGGWASPRSTWAEIFIKPLLEQVPFDVAFPSPLEGKEKLKWFIRALPYNARYRWRRWLDVVPEDKVRKTMRRLWRESKLQRASWDEFYRLSI